MSKKGKLRRKLRASSERIGGHEGAVNVSSRTAKIVKIKSPMNRRIQSLLQRHVEQFAQEIAEELARPLLDDFASRLVDGRGRETPTTTEPHAVETSHYDPRTRRWFCPRCKKFVDLARRAVTTHMRSCQPGAAEELKPNTCPKCSEEFSKEAQLIGHLRWCGREKAVIRICLAPGCKRHNKGPRFRYLCVKHLKASPKQVERWRKERAERVAAANGA